MLTETGEKQAEVKATDWVRSLSRFVFSLLNAEVLETIFQVWQVARKVITAKASEGLYEVLEYDAQLELQDKYGRTAVFNKKERVKFLQDNVIAYQDMAWG